jgi:hypothetical protein
MIMSSLILHPSQTMSNAQVLYLEHLITKKLRQEKIVRKFVAHQNLRSRLQPLVKEAENEISGSQGALVQVIEEAKSWLETGHQGRMQGLDQDVSMRDSCERLAHVSLTDAPTKTDVTAITGEPISVPELELVHV